jgi:hypothetical protein
MSAVYKLDNELIKALLEEIEASGVSRSEFDLRQLVNRKSFTYGEAGSEKRRALQKKFTEIKRKSSHQYLKFLAKFGVTPGEALKREILSSKDEDEVEEEPQNSEDQDEEESSESSASDDSSTSSKPSPKLKKARNPTPIKASPAKTPAKIPVTAIEFSVIKSPQPKCNRIMSDTESTTEESSFSCASFTDVLRRVEILEKPENKQDGSKECPYIIIVDPKKPETCQGFEVALIPQLQVGNFVRSVYHIRHVTTQGMEDEWSATIPHEQFPSLANCCVLIRGPSQELWHRRPDLYHEDPFCHQTALIHEAQQTAIKQSIVRLYSYWLLVLPKGITLENYIISQDSVHILKSTREMTQAFETEDEHGKAEMETLYGMDVYWRIAVAGGNMVTDPGSAAKKRRKKKVAVKT